MSRKKISISPRFDEQVAQLRKDGFTAIYKARGRYVPGKGLKVVQSNPGERIRLDDTSFILEKGESWFPVYYDGKNYRTVFFHPDGVEIPQGAIIHFGAKDGKQARPMAISPASKDYVEGEIYWHKCRAKNVKATFITSSGETKEITTHREHLDTLEEWNGRDPKADSTIASVKGASEAGQAERLLSYAVEEMRRECGDDLTETHWSILESAFRAGRAANECASWWNGREIAIAGEPMTTKQLTQHTARRVWTKAATDILRRDPKASSKSIAHELKSAGIVDFDVWGDDIEFYDEGAETKSKGAFEKAISDLRKKIRK